MIPSSCTSPPNRLQENAWPNSWISLMMTKVAQSQGQLPGSIALLAAVLRRVRFRPLAGGGAADNPDPRRAPHVLGEGRLPRAPRPQNLFRAPPGDGGERPV